MIAIVMKDTSWFMEGYVLEYRYSYVAADPATGLAKVVAVFEKVLMP